jgi:regulator of sirC expression with transglutaminase-like and TPR domain
MSEDPHTPDYQFESQILGRPYQEPTAVALRKAQRRIKDLEAELATVVKQRGHYCRKLGPVCRALTYLLSYVETLPNSDIDPTTREQLLKDGYAALQGKPYDL